MLKQGPIEACRNRRYRLVAALLILGVGTGVVPVLLVDWLNTLVK
jgi:hypothetical protein